MIENFHKIYTTVPSSGKRKEIYSSGFKGSVMMGCTEAALIVLKMHSASFLHIMILLKEKKQGISDSLTPSEQPFSVLMRLSFDCCVSLIPG